MVTSTIETHTCKRCGKEKPIGDFRNRGTYKCHECRTCRGRYQTERGRAIRAGTWLASRQRRDTQKALRSPSLKDIAWASGFIEGEGHFRKYPKPHSCSVTAAQVDLEPLRRLQEIFGGGISTSRRGYRGWQPLSAWHIYGSRARGVMMTLYTFMSGRRREQIRHALSVAL